MPAITIYRGDSYPILFSLKDKATTMPIDLTASTFKLTVSTVKEPPDNTSKVFDVAGVLTSTPKDGIVAFTPTASNTAVAGKFFYDVQMTVGSTVRTVAKDTWTVAMDITK